MRKLLAVLPYLTLWLLVTFTGGLIGAWWPIRNIDEPWVGDGFGVMLFGVLGLFVGAIAGMVLVIGILRFRATSRRST